ncbi:erythrose-4-phosphate dehydrogenase, partial [Desulfococcaceae bacterium OttesenSCG-928-F15]|nr:erythrose-4-phosphate dehydrogenase [Desulfococcaceae bacterium OttesenSCG-928-F15]
KRSEAEIHIRQGAGKVLFSSPAEANVDATIVFGLNEHLLSKNTAIVSNASCTTNCICHVIDALDRSFGIESGIITTIHSVMNDQPVIDAYHHSDLRRTRSSSASIIPVETGLAFGIGRILPELQGRFQALSLRVPVTNVSIMQLAARTKIQVEKDAINRALLEYAGKKPEVMGYTEEPLVSCDYIHDTRSSIVDGTQTRIVDGNLLTVMAWCDNEWGYANRMLDTAEKMTGA